MRWLVISGVLLSALGTGNALECYTCSGHIGIPNSLNECQRFNYYENHKKTLCMPGDQVCAKYVVNHDGMIWVHRSCNRYDVCGILNSVYSNGRDQLLECTTCSDSNLCNSGMTYYSASVVITLIIYNYLLNILLV